WPTRRPRHLLRRARRHAAGRHLPGRPTEATVPAGTVIEIVNAGPASHRVQGDIVFDTGTLSRGERTTVVLTNDGTSDKRIALTDPTDPGVSGAITVRPKPNAGS